MLRAYLPGFVLSAAVVAAAAVVYASLDRDRADARRIQLFGGTAALEIRLPAVAVPGRSHDRNKVAVKLRPGDRVGTSLGVVRQSVGVRGSTGSSATEGVSHRAGSGTTPTRPRAGLLTPVTPAPAPVTTPAPQQATPASGGDDPDGSDDLGRVRAPEVAAQSEPSGSDDGDGSGVEGDRGDQGGQGGLEVDVGDAADSGDDDLSGDGDLSGDDPTAGESP